MNPDPSPAVPRRQLLVRRALEFDDPALAPEDEALVEERLAKGRREPKSAVPLEEMERRLRSRFAE